MLCNRIYNGQNKELYLLYCPKNFDIILQKKIISDNLITRDVKKGTIIHNGNLDCTGLLLVKSGQLRTYILSDEGREITLYRLFDMDMCLLSASCIMRSIQFEVTIEAEKDTDLWIIPAEIYKGIMNESAPVANYTNELMATRFSDVMWLIEQIMWKSLDKRVASFLLEETSIEETNELKITPFSTGILAAVSASSRWV